MLMAATAVLIGFAVLIWSADLFVSGAASIAENLGMSPILIGLTIVSLGTSAPEVVVSLIASLTGAGDLAIGNAIGSNIANVGLVLGVTLLVAPILVLPGCMQRELPALLLVTIGVALLIADGKATALDGGLMLFALVVILVQLIRNQTADETTVAELDEEPLPHLKPLKAWGCFFAGLVLLVISSRALVWGASAIALELGVSNVVIGLTVVAVGTSLPELAASVASALKGHSEIAIGNVIGSNLFNLLGVMSIPALVAPQILEPGVLTRDYPAMSLLTLLLAIAMLVGRRHPRSTGGGNAYLGRGLGALLVALYGMYYCWLFLTI